MDGTTIDEALRREADDLLYAHGFQPLLQRYGIPHLHGSYALQLMTWRYLDVYLVADALSVDTFFALGGTIATALEPVRMQFRNERLAHTPGLPPGLYWGVHLNNGIERDHGDLKQRLHPMRGFKRATSAGIIVCGHALIRNLRNGFSTLTVSVPINLRLAVAWPQLALVI